jgi:serine/threonine protein kinase
LLGKGGFGLVYLAHDDQLQRLVAVKVPHAHRKMSTRSPLAIVLPQLVLRPFWLQQQRSAGTVSAFVCSSTDG